MSEKNKNIKNNKREKMPKALLFTVVISALVLMGGLVFGLLSDNGIIASTNDFENNTKVNGINVAGMSKSEAANIVASQMIENKNNIKITLKHEDKQWELSGKDFQAENKIFPIIEQAYSTVRNGTTAQKMARARKLKNIGINYDISYRHILGGFDDKISEISTEIEKASYTNCVKFDPSKQGEEMFSLAEDKQQVKVDKNQLYTMIDEAFKQGTAITINVPTEKVNSASSAEDILKNTKLRASFSTSYSDSAEGRKNNVKRALEDFNGMIVQTGEEISFNNITGDKTPEKGYMKAKIILNGIYVEDYGGGACQASTTLYNALILSDIEILEVHPHSMPVSYVPLAFDAMVSEGYSDLRFKNNTGSPLYIKAYGDNDNAYVEIYGAPIEEGIEIKKRAEFIETLPHSGDVIKKDVEGKYSDKVTYEGEYYRIKKPQEGYHAKAYLQYWKDDALLEEKLIRDEIYKPQQGIIMEGTEALGEGMELPENEVKIVPPQENSNIGEISAKRKIGMDSPSHLNP